MSTGVRRGDGKAAEKDERKCNWLQHKSENRGGKTGSSSYEKKKATEKPVLRRKNPNGEKEGVL